jgi:hypothetical protein
VLRQRLAQDWTGDIQLLVVATLKALAAWLIIALPLVVLLYVLVLTILRRLTPDRGMPCDGHVMP